jgi:hypothetical protein
MSVTPVVGLATVITTGGTAVTVLPANLDGGLIVNPLSATDQGVSVEPIYVDPTGAAPGLTARGSVFRIEAGQSWTAIPGQTTVTKVNATTSGHNFSAISW